jgi:hypothetical protein
LDEIAFTTRIPVPIERALAAFADLDADGGDEGIDAFEAMREAALARAAVASGAAGGCAARSASRVAADFQVSTLPPKRSPDLPARSRANTV